MITHDLDLLWQVADRVAVLGEGTVQAVGSMEELSQLDIPRCASSSKAARRRAAAQALRRGRRRRAPWKPR